MKTAHTLLKYFKERAKNINKILSRSPEEYDSGTYHQLRVEIKKLNALSDLVKYCNKKFDQKKYFRPFKKIFKKSGRVRELQLEESVLKKYGQYSIENYLAKVKANVKKAKNDFYSVINKKRTIKIKEAFKNMALFIKDIHKNEVNNFIENERKKINELIQQSPLKPAQVHELRKRLKVDFYNWESLDQACEDKLKAEDDLQKVLGKWHDGTIMNNYLEKSIMKEKIDSAELKQLLQIDEEIILNTRQLFAEINTRIRTKSLFV